MSTPELDYAAEARAILFARKELKVQCTSSEDLAMLWVMEAQAYALLEIAKQIELAKER